MWSSISASSVMVRRMIKESALVRYSIVSAAKTVITAVMLAAALSSCFGAVRCVAPVVLSTSGSSQLLRRFVA